MESMEHESMVTMYHLDKGRVMMTHYCSAQTSRACRPRCRMTGRPFTSIFSMLPTSQPF